MAATTTPGRLPVTVLIPACNEEEMLPECLASAAWADEILVVDSGSTDRTREIARAAGARVLEHPYEYSAKQKNWAIPQCGHEWVLLLDADERLTPELTAEIQALLARGPEAPGYWIRRENVFLGRVMRHGGWETDTVVRLFQRDRARYQDVMVHAEIDLPGPLPTLAHPLRHDTFRSFTQYWPKVERYSVWGATKAWNAGRRASVFTVLARTVGRFARMYVLRRGFLDGGHGLVLALFASFSTYLKYARLWEMTLRGGPDGQPR